MAGPKLDEDTFEREFKIMGVFIDNAKTLRPAKRWCFTAQRYVSPRDPWGFARAEGAN